MADVFYFKIIAVVDLVVRALKHTYIYVIFNIEKGFQKKKIKFRIEIVKMTIQYYLIEFPFPCKIGRRLNWPCLYYMYKFFSSFCVGQKCQWNFIQFKI